MQDRRALTLCFPMQAISFASKTGDSVAHHTMKQAVSVIWRKSICYDGLTHAGSAGCLKMWRMNMYALGNEQCRDQADANIKLGNFHMAMRWFNTAAARTIGHKKTDMYERKAAWCAEQIGVSYDRGNFAEEREAMDLRQPV